MRYGEQIFEVEVPLDGVDWSGPDPIAAVTEELCRGCGFCVSVCPYDAIELVEGTASVHETLCRGCGACAPAWSSRCRF